MAKIYYNRIKAGTWTVEQVPSLWRETVQELLDEDGE